MDARAKQALKKFLGIYGDNQSVAARVVGYSSNRISQLCNGEGEISDMCAARIHAVTNGEISMFDLSVNLRKLQSRAEKERQ